MNDIYRKMYEQTNLFNRLVNMMKKSGKSYESILDKIQTLNITSHKVLLEVIDKADKEKIAKLIDIGLPMINK